VFGVEESSTANPFEVLLFEPYLGDLGVFFAPGAETIVDPLVVALGWHICLLGPLDGTERIGLNPGIEDCIHEGDALAWVTSSAS
jgi:hypothetical protein